MGILPYAGLKFYIYEGLKAHVPDDYKSSVTLKLSCGAALLLLVYLDRL